MSHRSGLRSSWEKVRCPIKETMGCTGKEGWSMGRLNWRSSVVPCILLLWEEDPKGDFSGAASCTSTLLYFRLNVSLGKFTVTKIAVGASGGDRVLCISSGEWGSECR